MSQPPIEFANVSLRTKAGKELGENIRDHQVMTVTFQLPNFTRKFHFYLSINLKIQDSINYKISINER